MLVNHGTAPCEEKQSVREQFDGGLFLDPTYGGVPGAVLHSGIQVVVSHFLL